MKYLFMVILLSSCGYDDMDNANRLARAGRLHYMLPDTRHQGVDEEFAKYVFIFEKYWDNNVNDIPINFGHVAPGAAAVCELMIDGRRQIIVDKSDWEDTRFSRHGYQEMIIFHELGHCVLSRNHRNKMSIFYNQKGEEYWAPASIMHKNGSEIGYLFNREYYLSELFREGKTSDLSDFEYYREYDERKGIR